ncbi:hypothetical protein KAW43_03110 [Candidatus Parcubacteria bacterium]|jgi:hypothetical protein|nr:hypothetical protein [Candidatus Parcubacteria bacterium]
MSIQIKKQSRENSQNLVRRFSRRIQQSGVLRRARNIRFAKRAKSAQLKKRTALRKEELKKEYELLRKLGKELQQRKRY